MSALLRFTLTAALGAAAVANTAPDAAAKGVSGPSRATLTERVAEQIDVTFDTLNDLEDDAAHATSALPRGWRWLDVLSTTVRTETSAIWLRDAANGFDDLLEIVDPRRLLPRLELERYRIMTVAPVASIQTSSFGWRYHPVLHRRKLHTGCDYRGKRGTMVRAAAPGVVIAAKRWSSYGNIVIIDHGMGVVTRYAHLSRIRVHEGERVAAGRNIGAVGATGRVTGPHLHFEVRLDGQPVDPDRSFVSWLPAAPRPTESAARELIRKAVPPHLRRNW